MRVSPFSPKRAGLLASFFALGVVAQQNNNNDNSADDDTANDTSTTTPADDSTADDSDADDTPANGSPADDTTTNDSPTKTGETTTDAAKPPAGTPTTAEGDEPPSTTTKDEQTTTTGPLPTLPALSSTTTTSFSRPTDMPTLSRTVNTEIPTYPPPTIPPTRNAPFMNHSTLPDGTVFIAVGAILGAFGVAILLWRAIVACLLHRSVERAALAQHAANNGRGAADKNAASFPAPPAQFYKYLERESSASLAGAGVGGSTGRRTNRGPTPSATPSQTNLFFSPTAAGSSSGMGGTNRDSARYLPSGFYASASPAAGGHGHGNSISMTTLRPSSRGRGGQLGPSPPESPDVGPRVMSRNFSTSSLNLNHPPSPGHRAPSAYLDDLLDEQPGMFPPAAGNAPSQGHGSQRGRY
ncbi:hypothetical protein MYCTH_2302452 [Thermothelomyces thermophilus ATCC 42464]|uniref:CSI2 protein n=1 Tax=Thermothelomyces thermophilus (strain ATCC 42464 / BCRC 31852 / DSM 1799) TaxID=573729 RepID=G2Q7S0_THET4|nr:uncharacterized protein MYCTH_2302452 [Thermothelomyces thermophilus ATCC 42464]AEO56929.1 hypothetical protein MYCTH_2302452 [Thermothelomyces thermophilus ATCC 42464]